MLAFQGLLLFVLTEDTLEFSVVAKNCSYLTVSFIWCGIHCLVFLFHAFLCILCIIRHEIHLLRSYSAVVSCFEEEELLFMGFILELDVGFFVAYVPSDF